MYWSIGDQMICSSVYKVELDESPSSKLACFLDYLAFIMGDCTLTSGAESLACILNKSCLYLVPLM